MIETFQKIWRFAKGEHNNIIKSMIVNFFEAVLYMIQIGAIFFAINGIVKHKVTAKTVWLCLGMILISVVGKVVARYFSQLQQTHAGYFMTADKRISIGEKIKRIPLGFFNQSSRGNMTGICTTVMADVELTAPMVLVETLGGFITALVFLLYVIIFDWRIGIIAVATVILYCLISSAAEKNSRNSAPKRQKAQAKLVENVLETVAGMPIVKSFNLSKYDDKKIDRAIKDCETTNFAVEMSIVPFAFLQQAIIALGSGAVIAASTLLFIGGSMELTYALMFVIIAFVIFGNIEAAGQGVSIMHVCSGSIEQACSVDDEKEMDIDGKEIIPDHYSIEFKNVTFAYDSRKILDNVSLKIPDRTTTAIVGPSGSGKTTVCSLIARFWDVDDGEILVGGHNIKEYSLKSLMDKISVVFQDVYLFSDTIENNIKFGCPRATHEQVVDAAKKACCHDFILAFPDGYNTIIGDGKQSVSGGEKQRISIARAILKNAPIIILDEATANVDPENEALLVRAIEELTRNKTIIMIAHRLKTVKNADHIIVLDDGKIAEQGTHNELIVNDGIYSLFVKGRKKSSEWRITKKLGV